MIWTFAGIPNGLPELPLVLAKAKVKPRQVMDWIHISIGVQEKISESSVQERNP